MSSPEVAVGIDIAARPERVWALVTDVTLLPRFRTIGPGWGPGLRG